MTWFLRDVTIIENCQEKNGFNTKLYQEQGLPMDFKTKVVYLPVMDSSLSDPKTMMTSIMKAEGITAKADREYLVYTTDRQLHWVALDLIWSNPDLCDNVFLRLSGMQFLLS